MVLAVSDICGASTVERPASFILSTSSRKLMTRPSMGPESPNPPGNCLALDNKGVNVSSRVLFNFSSVTSAASCAFFNLRVKLEKDNSSIRGSRHMEIPDAINVTINITKEVSSIKSRRSKRYENQIPSRVNATPRATRIRSIVLFEVFATILILLETAVIARRESGAFLPSFDTFSTPPLPRKRKTPETLGISGVRQGVLERAKGIEPSS